MSDNAKTIQRLKAIESQTLTINAMLMTLNKDAAMLRQELEGGNPSASPEGGKKKVATEANNRRNKHLLRKRISGN